MKKFVVFIAVCLLLAGCSKKTSTQQDKSPKAEKTEEKQEEKNDKAEGKNDVKDSEENPVQIETDSPKQNSSESKEKIPSSTPSSEKQQPVQPSQPSTNPDAGDTETYPPAQPQQPVENPVDITDVTGYAEELFQYINNYRLQNGLPVLQHHSGAQLFADKRAVEIMSNFSHSTNYDIRNETGLTPGGENIASGGSAIGTFNIWKQSAGHNNTMLADYIVYGAIGVKKDSIGRTYWVLVTLTDIPATGGWH